MQNFSKDLRRAETGHSFACRKRFEIKTDDFPPFTIETIEAGLTIEFMSRGPGDGRLMQPSREQDLQGEAVYPGRKLNVGAWVRIATAARSQDADIVDQCRSGVRSRARPARAITIFFPHSGLVQHMRLARPKVEAEIKEGWSLPPTQHLPCIPATVNPRDCILQQKIKEHRRNNAQHLV